MYFADIDKNYIKNNSFFDKYYEFSLGNPIEVTSTKKKHLNALIAENLSTSKKEDSLMIQYQPTNNVCFTKDFMESSGISASCHIDIETSKVVVGKRDEFQIRNGILTFSGFLSLNNFVEKHKKIYGNSKVKETLVNRVRVLSVGLRGDKLYALYYIPNTRGVYIGVNSDNLAISSTAGKFKDCENLTSFIIDDWFENTKIRER